MSLGSTQTDFLASLAKKHSLQGQRLSLCQDGSWLYVLSYDLRTAQPVRSMRMARAGASRAKVEVFYPQSASWYAVKEGGAKLRCRKDLLDSGATLRLVLALIADWRDFSEYGEYETTADCADSGFAHYYRIDEGALAEQRVNSRLPSNLSPAYVIGLKSGQARNWRSYPLLLARDSKLHIYDRTALPTFSPEGTSELPERLGLGIPLYEPQGCLLLAEFMPLVEIPAVFLLQDIAGFARNRRQQLVDCLLQGVVQVMSFLRGERDSGKVRECFFSDMLRKDLATLNSSFGETDSAALLEAARGLGIS